MEMASVDFHAIMAAVGSQKLYVRAAVFEVSVYHSKQIGWFAMPDGIVFPKFGWLQKFSISCETFCCHFTHCLMLTKEFCSTPGKRYGVGCWVESHSWKNPEITIYVNVNPTLFNLFLRLHVGG